ncbi:hypothetical protein QTL97_08035 [Sporosarcina thermotolerans]|uniref:ABC transporter permease n=1 Tax=Sporosarcina thermotolerans TaxID=633404 RepID=A0AAW9A7B9_9BACL|nr:hypothetical protein [Sporosarcina thermotolerans]MDW0116879.1 hypothetical protein [Sporosarcina thermotolerans]WHT47997.1 hypothetical protein QNH10_18355 [Sporosarcina thermotolerans]
MNRNYLKHEFLITARSRRTIPFVFFIAVLLFCFCLILWPYANTKEAFNKKETEEYLTYLGDQQKLWRSIGNTGIVFEWISVNYYRQDGHPVYAANARNYELFSGMLKSFEDRDFARLLNLRTFYLLHNPDEYLEDRYLFQTVPFPSKDRKHAYYQTMMKYEDYHNKDYPVTFGLMYEKTGLQTLQNFLQNYGVYFLLFCVIYFSSDILARDRKHQAVLQGLPLSWYRQLNLKSLSAFLYSMAFIISFIVVGVLAMTIQFGFGYFDLNVPIMIQQKTFTPDDYSVISLGSYLGKTLVIIPLLVILFVRLNIVLSLIFKNEWIVLFTSSLLLFSERLYFSRSTKELFGMDISLFPQTYFDFGKIIDGEKNFLLNTETITYAKGILVILITYLVIEVMLYIVSLIINKRRFYLAN